MRLLEHESKEILAGYGIRSPKGRLVLSPDDIRDMTGPVVLKAQVPVGGRGKVGGVLEASSVEEAKERAALLFPKEIRGYRPRAILMEDKVRVREEFFLSIIYDTVEKAPVALFSREGGMDIEELAARQPEKVKKQYFSVRFGLPQYRAREMISEAGISGRLLVGLGSVFSTLARLFLDYDAIIAEINPLALTHEGELVALDCHLEVDDDALSRHSDLAEKLRDEERVTGGRIRTEFEKRAAEIDNIDHRGVAGRVIEFDGTLGLIIGGGGASLTAFDAVLSHGGRPANYCEVGGNPSVRKVKELTKLILSRKGVEKIAVITNVLSNTRVDLVARGVIKGIMEMGMTPSDTIAVFRVPGAWEDEGMKILSRYGVPYCGRTVSIDEAARIAVERAREQ